MIDKNDYVVMKYARTFSCKLRRSNEIEEETSETWGGRDSFNINCKRQSQGQKNVIHHT
jgi:hypothetical protein